MKLSHFDGIAATIANADIKINARNGNKTIHPTQKVNDLFIAIVVRFVLIVVGQIIDARTVAGKSRFGLVLVVSQIFAAIFVLWFVHN